MHSHLGDTRSANQPDHLLQTPDTFVRTELPGMKNGIAIVHVSPARGAAFTQYTAELEIGGMLGSTNVQRFLYMLHGAATLTTHNGIAALARGGYAYVPEGADHELKATQKSRIAVIEKKYVRLDGAHVPDVIIGQESTVVSTPLNNDPDLQVRSLLPGDSGFDFAVNTMTYKPGASLSMVEIHVMEHGLLMLEGGGIYRLSDRWYPVMAGDFIWMAAYCPQWFGAIGKTPAKYLIYKDGNRHPLS
jgi:(S)-ureidoglycine aminohydrolase